MTQPLLTVVLPVYNESMQLHASIERLSKTLQGIPHRIIAVNDGSTDDTLSNLRAIKLPNFEVLTYEVNRGKGFALRQGIQAIESEYGAYIDADLDLHPESLILGLQELQKDPSISIALGSKVHPKSTVRYSMLRKLLSRAYRVYVRLLLEVDVSDTQTGLKVFRTAQIQQAAIHCESNGWTFDLELLTRLKNQGDKFVEIPVELDYQFSSSMDLKSALKALTDTVAVAKLTR